MRGKAPKPTKLKILAGKPGHRPLPKGEPMPTGTAVRPGWLNARAAKVWDELAPGVGKLGLLTDHDAKQFAMLCYELAEYERAPLTTPQATKSLIMKLFAEFGMGPAARTRISVKAQTPQDDEQRFFGGKTA
jgi:phage terminase small subunit